MARRSKAKRSQPEGGARRGGSRRTAAAQGAPRKKAKPVGIAKKKIAARAPKPFEPVRLTKGRLPDSDEGGPVEWLRPMLGSAYAALRQRGAPQAPQAA